MNGNGVGEKSRCRATYLIGRGCWKHATTYLARMVMPLIGLWLAALTSLCITHILIAM